MLTKYKFKAKTNFAFLGHFCRKFLKVHDMLRTNNGREGINQK